MAQLNGRDHTKTNKYDSANRYEAEHKQANTGSPQPSAPAVVPKPALQEFQPRSLPTPTPYNPHMGESRRGRRRAERLIGDLHLGSAVAEAGVTYEGALSKLEGARQSRELVEQRRTQLPAKIELENLKIGNELLHGRIEFEAMVEEQQDQRAERERRRQIDREDFEIVLNNRRADKLESEARVAAAEAQASMAPEIGKRKAEAELHQAAEAALGKEADAEAERRRRDQERHKRTQARPPEAPDDMPAPLAAHYATEKKVRESRDAAATRAEQIRTRAAAEGRELTEAEVEEIDALNDAAAGAEGTIRRGAATDFAV